MLRALGVLGLLCATAAAEPTLELRIEGKSVEATLRGAPASGPVELHEMLVEDKPPIVATSVHNFLDGGPVSVAFVLSGDAGWMGAHNIHDDDYDPDHVSLHKPLSAAFDVLQLASALPAGSEAMVVRYDTEAAILVPWKPAGQVGGIDLGAAKDFAGRLGVDMVHGIELACTELATRPQRRKLMIIIGDGNDTATDINDAGYNLRALAETCPGVTSAALVIKSPISAETDAMEQWTPNVIRLTSVNAASGLEAALKKTLQLATDQFDATFPLAKFPRDGKRRSYLLVSGGQELASATLQMLDPPAPPSPPWQLWRWLVLAGVVGAFSLISLLVFKARGPQ